MKNDLWADSTEPPIGSRVEALGRVWQRQPEGYWIADGSDEPESWTKVAGSYGPARLLFSPANDE